MKLSKSDIRVLANNIAEFLLSEYSVRGETQEVDQNTLTGDIAAKIEEFFG